MPAGGTTRWERKARKLGLSDIALKRFSRGESIVRLAFPMSASEKRLRPTRPKRTASLGLLAGCQIDIPQDEQNGQNPDQHIDFADLASRDLHDRIGNE